MTTETIELTEDQNVVALRHILELQQAVGTIASVLKGTSVFKEGLNKELAENVLKVSEYKLSDLCKLLGIETHGTREREERHADLRRANGRIRELEEQLGNSQGADVTQSALKNLDAQLNSWWDLEGFGHISDIAFQRYGCKVNFSCALYGDFRLINSDTPVSDKERKALWLASLRERGFVLVQEDRDWEIQDCDASRAALCNLIVERIPSATVSRIENFHRRKANSFTLRSVEVYIHNLADIAQLPQKPSKEG
ncbi:hypothetical protein [Burkholderia ubonensis]|uniref:hypothetical protein n=1 Tax=Burkholderia ubonensis TaxID=101571 RepID=UPI000756E2ED|nr:hypothetical protein [Burkholderia ubonensis]KVP17083.1 hypothetical protein WJ84_02060 [Burkholderia ubonensis]KVP39793.1 hypothetical protein WJ87_06315 [Burkholderia ubonensis]